MLNKTGIIFINYKDYATKYLAACYDSLLRQTEQNFKVYIVDNDSSSETFEYLKSNYPNCEILTRTDGNYAAANNLGIKVALADGCEQIVVANMDVEFDAQWLEELIKALSSDAEIGIAQSLMYLEAKTEAEKIEPKINSIGNIINFQGFAFTNGYGQNKKDVSKFLESSTYPEIKGYASGCSLMIKAEVLRKIKGYNEEFYMYHDDLELSLKTKLAGYKIVLAPKSTLFHKYEFKRSVKMIYYMERNRHLFVLSFYPRYLIILIFPTMLIMDFGMIFYSMLGGWFKEGLKVYRYFFRFSTYQKIRQTRRELKEIRVVSFASIAKDFSGQVDFQEINNPVLKYLVNPAFNLYWRLIKNLL